MPVKLAAFADEPGAGLVEILCAIGILSIVLTIFVSALSTGAHATRVVHERVTAENIARSQLEYMKDTPFIEGTDCYTPTVVSSTAYTATISATTVYTGVQRIIVTVFHYDKPTFTVEEYKVDRE